MNNRSNDDEMIEGCCCCCTQQIDNLLAHAIDGPTIISSSVISSSISTSTKSLARTPDERSGGSGAEDAVVVVSISPFVLDGEFK